MTKEQVYESILMAPSQLLVEVHLESKVVTEEGVEKIVADAQVREAYKIVKYNQDAYPHGLPGTHAITRAPFLDKVAIGDNVYFMVDIENVLAYIDIQE